MKLRRYDRLLRGEFRSLAEAWSNGVTEVLSRVAYDAHERKSVYLRSCSWLDACLHAPIWWTNHQRRPFYIASVRAYNCGSSHTENQQMWSWMQTGSQGLAGERRGAAEEMDSLRYYTDSMVCVVHIEGTTAGFFDVDSLDNRQQATGPHVA